MAVITRAGGVQRRRATRRRVTRGYSAGRRAYDARRRRKPLTGVDRVFRDIVVNDVCLSPRCDRPATDADHIVPLEDGGENEWQDLAGICHACNASKSNDPLLLYLLRRVNGATDNPS